MCGRDIELVVSELRRGACVRVSVCGVSDVGGAPLLNNDSETEDTDVSEDKLSSLSLSLTKLAA